MRPTALVTDSTADLPEGSGPVVVPAHVAFSDRNFSDAEITAAEYYRRLRSSDDAPYLSCPSEDEYRAAFEKALTEGGSVLCLVTPFDMIPSFTSANAAAVTLRPETIKIVNPGVASVGLGALLISLQEGVKAGWELTRLIDTLDDLAPASDSMFVPAGLDWLDRTGRLKVIEERLGDLGDDLIVVRAGTRLTGIAAAGSRPEIHDRLLTEVARRAGGDRPMVVCVDHAQNPEDAVLIAGQARERWNVVRLEISELSPTFGAQFGPGAVGVGVAPFLET
jgi:DegV family protein with EDD domain